MKGFCRHRVSPLKKTLFVYKRPEQAVPWGVQLVRFGFPWICILWLISNSYWSFFQCRGHIKEYSWSSQLSREPMELFPGGWCDIPVAFRPWFLDHWYNNAISSKTRRVTVSLRVDPMHTRSESGGEPLDKGGQLQMEINFILSLIFERFWRQNLKAKRGNVHSAQAPLVIYGGIS